VRRRLLVAMLGVVAIMLVAQDVPLAGHLHDVERDRELSALERDAFILAGQAAAVLRPEPSTTPDDAEEAAWALDILTSTITSHARDHERGVEVVGPDGTVVTSAGRTVREASADVGADPDIAAALGSASAAGDDPGIVSVAVPVLDGADVVGAVRLSTTTDDINDRADARVRGLGIVAAISLATAVIVAILISGTVTRPLRQMQTTTERVARGELDERVDDAQGPPEVRQLARSLNTMTERIARLVDQERAFAADASHQLRTPLTALRLQLERTNELVESDSAGALRNLDAATHEIARLQRMIDGLLVLSRGHARDGAAPEPVRVDEIVAERAAVWMSLAEEQGVTLTTWIPGPATALATPSALEQILDNYLDNAIAVAPSGTTVEIVVDGPDPSARGQTISIHVLDRGPGLSDEQLASAFGRFWRAPDNPNDGTGLGLAIVAQLAASSGGRAELSRRVGGGIDAAAHLRLTMPAAISD
jgi:signal transduction histidine kinase